MSEYRPSAEALERELKRMKRKRRHHQSVVGLFFVVLIALAVGVTIERQFRIDVIHGVGMNNTLVTSDVVLSVKTSNISRGDIVVMVTRDGQFLIRRVIGRGGDRVDISPEGVVSVNGTALEERYAIGATLPGAQQYPITVSQGAYFVLGDNRAECSDSRDFGQILDDDVIGKPLAVIWPFYHFARLNADE